MRVLNKGDFVGYIDRPVRNACDAPWHLVQVLGGSEQTIADYLASQGYVVYVPITRMMKPVAMRHLSHKQRQSGATVKRPKIAPLFPGYQFVRIDIADGRWHDVFRLRGVRGLVMNDDKPARVPELVVDKIKSCEVGGVIPGKLTLAGILTFHIGENVRITDGPFRDFPAVVSDLPKNYQEMLRTQTLEELDESMAVTLLVSLFGQQTAARMTFGQIEKV